MKDYFTFKYNYNKLGFVSRVICCLIFLISNYSPAQLHIINGAEIHIIGDAEITFTSNNNELNIITSSHGKKITEKRKKQVKHKNSIREITNGKKIDYRKPPLTKEVNFFPIKPLSSIEIFNNHHQIAFTTFSISFAFLVLLFLFRVNNLFYQQKQSSKHNNELYIEQRIKHSSFIRPPPFHLEFSKKLIILIN